MGTVLQRGMSTYQRFLSADGIISFAMGLFGPFWVIFLQSFGGSSESLGFAVGLRMFAYSLAAYTAGRLSDVFGRRAFMITGRTATAGIIFVYTQISSVTQLYILQILLGIVAAMDSTATTAFLGDITNKASRGTDIGKFSAVTGIVSAIAMMLGGVIVGNFGVEAIFYIVGGLFCVSSCILPFVKET